MGDTVNTGLGWLHICYAILFLLANFAIVVVSTIETIRKEVLPKIIRILKKLCKRKNSTVSMKPEEGDFMKDSSPVISLATVAIKGVKPDEPGYGRLTWHQRQIHQVLEENNVTHSDITDLHSRSFNY